MGLCPRAAMVALIVAFCLASAAASVAHEPTLQRFQREQAVALAQVLQTAEAAPRAEASVAACRLTIELLLDGNPQPVAGLIRVTNLDSGKALAFADEIHRDKNWYAVSPRTVLLVPR